MHYCPEPSCEYKTEHSKNLRRHVERTRHGQQEKRKEFKGYLADNGTKKRPRKAR